MTLSEYSQIKQQVVLTVRSSHNDEILRKLKDFFNHAINSVRRFEQINSIGDLLQVLELRGLLSEENVAPLKNIAQLIQSPDLLRKVNEYVPKEHSNLYGSTKLNKSIPSNTFLDASAHSTAGVTTEKDQQIILTVVERIGYQWITLARSLDIQEWRIDEIDSSDITLFSKAKKMLNLFRSRADPRKWHFILMDALQNIRRKDLKESIQEILLRQ